MAEVESELIRQFSIGGFAIIEKIGHQYGTSYARRAVSDPLPTTIANLQSLASAAGWGKFLVMCDENGSWIRIISKGCVFCCGTRETVPEDECSFLFRVIQGMAEVFYNRKYAILRNKCYESLGIHSCEIALQESSGDPDLQRKSRKPNNPLNKTYP